MQFTTPSTPPDTEHFAGEWRAPVTRFCQNSSKLQKYVHICNFQFRSIEMTVQMRVLRTCPCFRMVALQIERSFLAKKAQKKRVGERETRFCSVSIAKMHGNGQSRNLGKHGHLSNMGISFLVLCLFFLSLSLSLSFSLGVLCMRKAVNKQTRGDLIPVKCPLP